MSDNKQSQPQPEKRVEALGRIAMWICCHCQTPRLEGLTVCERCGKRLHDTVEYAPLPQQPASERCEECVKCGHTCGTDRSGQCVYQLTVPADSVAVWDDNHCGCKCEYPATDAPCHVSVTGKHRIDDPYCKDCGQSFPLVATTSVGEGGERKGICAGCKREVDAGLLLCPSCVDEGHTEHCPPAPVVAGADDNECAIGCGCPDDPWAAPATAPAADIDYCTCLTPLGSKTCYHCKKAVKPSAATGPAQDDLVCAGCGVGFNEVPLALHEHRWVKRDASRTSTDIGVVKRLKDEYYALEIEVAALLDVVCGASATHLGIRPSLTMIEQEVNRLRAELEAAQSERETDVIQANRLWRIWLWNEFEIDVRLSDDEARAEMLQRVRDANADYGYLRYTVLPERVAEARANAIRDAVEKVQAVPISDSNRTYKAAPEMRADCVAALQSLLDQKEREG